jgi:hypothetical protein
MNPFVNPKKRSVSLPPGCKDLVDVLHRPKRRGDSPGRIFVRLMLMQAHEHHATQLVIGSAVVPESTITEKIGSAFYHVSALPSDFRTSVVEEVARMAALPNGVFPREGQILIRLETTQLRWRVRQSSADADIVLTPMEEP